MCLAFPFRPSLLLEQGQEEAERRGQVSCGAGLSCLKEVAPGFLVGLRVIPLCPAYVGLGTDRMGVSWAQTEASTLSLVTWCLSPHACGALPSPPSSVFLSSDLLQWG